MSDEQYGFVFAVTFIIIFSTLLATIPADLQGQESTVETITPVNPSLLTDFSASEDFVRTDFNGLGAYAYVLGSREWICATNQTAFELGAKVLVGGILWLGGMDVCRFIFDGENRGTIITLDDLDSDADDGTVRYDLQFEDTGNSAGGFVFYWNTTTYSDSSEAWTADKLYLLHGIGLTADTNIASLLIALLFLQLPGVPVLVNVLLVVPIWASIVYVLWFIIKEMIPFLG